MDCFALDSWEYLMSICLFNETTEKAIIFTGKFYFEILMLLVFNY